MKGIDLPSSLAELLGSEAADTVQTKAEDEAVFFSQTHVKGRELNCDGTAIPRMSQGNGRVDERVVSPSRPLLEVEEERRATKQTVVAISEKY